MAGHLDLKKLKNENPFKKDKGISKKELFKIVKHKIAGKSLEEFKNIKIIELPAKEYVFNYEKGDKAFGISRYPMSEEFKGAIIEYHVKKNSEDLIYIVL